MNLDPKNEYYEYSNVKIPYHKKFKPCNLITNPSWWALKFQKKWSIEWPYFSDIPVKKDNPMANRHMLNLKIPIQILKDNRPALIKSKTGAFINLADRRQLFIGDHHIKIIDDNIKVICYLWIMSQWWVIFRWFIGSNTHKLIYTEPIG